jgi:hypothetical protein
MKKLLRVSLSFATVLCVSAQLPAFSQENESDELGFTTGHWESRRYDGRLYAEVTDPETGARFMASCLENALGFQFLYSEDQLKYAADGEVTVSFDFTSGRVDVEGTSQPQKGFAASYVNNKNQSSTLNAYQKIIGMKSSDVSVIMIVHPERGNIGSIGVSGSGSSKALGAVLRECGR